MNLVLNSQFLVFAKELPHKLSIINLNDNTLVTFNDFHASAMDLILNGDTNIESLMELYKLDYNSCEAEFSKLVQYLSDHGIITNKL